MYQIIFYTFSQTFPFFSFPLSFFLYKFFFDFPLGDDKRKEKKKMKIIIIIIIFHQIMKKKKKNI